MAKNIVVCCDGTGNEYGDENTNVVKLFERLVRDQDQIAFYDPGVGTFSVFGRNLGKKIGYIMGMGFGYGLTENIEDAYVYLMDHYEPGDRVFLFGFSRGAFTARALAGMLHKVGLLQKGSNNLIPYATKIYNTRKNQDVADGFKKAFCHECKPHFVGVWDTVGSLGLWLGRKFFDARLNPDVANACHAISIDEKRKKFPVSIWDETALASHQRVEQVWFVGVHSDVGGSYKEVGLSDIALLWMLERAEACGMRLRPDWRDKIAPDPFGEIHKSRKGLWCIWPPVDRVIPDGAKIHRSAIERMAGDPNYKPKLPPGHSVV